MTNRCISASTVKRVSCNITISWFQDINIYSILFTYWTGKKSFWKWTLALKHDFAGCQNCLFTGLVLIHWYRHFTSLIGPLFSSGKMFQSKFWKGSVMQDLMNQNVWMIWQFSIIKDIHIVTYKEAFHFNDLFCKQLRHGTGSVLGFY
jgi:hypothetical protein